jgi:hypothetical protein
MAVVPTIDDCRPKANPLERPDVTEAEVQAVRACHRGDATERQQRMALDCFIRIFGTHDTSFRPGDQYQTAFAEGRRNAGTTIIWMINQAPTKTSPDKISARKLGDDPNGRADNRG